MIRCVMERALFEVAESSNQEADELRLTLRKAKEDRETKHTLLVSANDKNL